MSASVPPRHRSPSVTAAGASDGRAVWTAVARRLLVRPRLWIPALRQAWRSTPAGWWRRPPFVPRPDARYLAFRFETQYGGAGAAPSADDVLEYLEWCAASERARSASAGRR